ncbi:hypothetical protein I7I50_03795 [Histoplasma capsulatum G186AR]|uniref:Uncharacterized protein n=1 Tax=Ajellomyces capsulatus TaxID=5037 RepID=A0A8H7YLG1_AJECA|nr:hypothetical protein I7I52_04702 [Histoplasma capsulatum]QSS74857.1 hypothetical protein I7I50_03795 [Histoplasma capsulatum G186AR]
MTMMYGYLLRILEREDSLDAAKKKGSSQLPSLASPAVMHAADFVLPPSIMKQDDLSSQGRRWIRPNSREIRPPETPVVDFESVAEIPRPTACYVMGYVEESERIPNIWCCTKDKLLFLRIPLTPNKVHILSRYHCQIAGAVG